MLLFDSLPSLPLEGRCQIVSDAGRAPRLRPQPPAPPIDSNQSLRCLQ